MRQYKILLASALALALGLSNFAKAGGHEGPHDQGMHAERPPQCDEAEEALRSMGVEPGALAQVAFSEMPPPEGAPEEVVAAFDDMLDAKVAAVFFGGDEEAAKAMFDQMDQFDVNPMDCGYFPPEMTKEMMEQGPDMHDDGMQHKGPHNDGGPHDQGMHAERPPQCDEAEEALRSMGVEPGALAQVAFSEMPPPEGAPEEVVAAFDDMLDAKVAAVFFGGDEEAAKAMFDQMDQFDVNPMDCGYFPPGMTKEMME